MKKNYFLLMLITLLGFSSRAMAIEPEQVSALTNSTVFAAASDYCRPTDGDNVRGYDFRGSRLITNLTFNGLTKDGQPFEFSKQPNRAGDFQSEVYRDFTNDIIECTQGDEVTVTFTRYNLEWMHFYLYIDYNQDGVFDIDNEVVSYSYYSETEADGPGKNGQVNEIPAFIIPADAITGQTRIRFKSDWNSLDPCGNPAPNNKIGANGGHIFDFTLNINAAGGGETPEPVENYALNYTVEGQGTVAMQTAEGAAVENGGTVAAGSNVTLSFNPAEGYVLGTVTVNEADVTASVVDGTYTIENIQAAQNIAVAFVEDTPVATTHAITLVADPFTSGEVTMTSNGAAVGGGTSGNTVEHGADLVISIKPNMGQDIDDVLINNVSVKAELTDGAEGEKIYTVASVEEDLLVSVKFKRAAYRVAYNVTPAEGGAVTLTSGTETIENGGEVLYASSLTVTLAPAAGFSLASLVINDADVTAGVVDNVYTIESVTEAKAINVTFAEETQTNDYCRPEGEDNIRASHHQTKRLITNLTFSGLTKDGQPVEFSKQPNKANSWYDTDTQVEVYRDFTADVIECTQGDNITVSFTRYELSWMHYYLYIDYDHDGVFNTDNEVVAYTYYADPEDSSLPGYDGNSDALPAFTIPADALTGQTRIRFKVDWNSLDPCGNPASNNKIGANGGHIFDFTLNINKAGDVPVVPEYNVTVSTVGEGTITLRGENNEVKADAVTEYTGQFQEDAFLNLAVAPAEGWTLGSVMMNDADMTEEIIDGNMSFVVGSDINFVVTYVEEAPATQYTLTVTTEGQGNLMLLSEEGVLNPMFTTLEENFDEDAYLGIAFSAADGWELGSLLVNGEERIADVAYGGYEFTMTQDMNIEVKFVEKQSTDGHLITLTTEGEGVVNMAVVNGGDVMSGDRVSNGADLMLYIYPAQEWEVKAVVINGVDVTASYVATTNELKVANITEDQNIVVTFSQKVGIDSNLAEAVYYDAAAQLFVAPAEAQVELFNITGAKVAEAQGNLNMAAMNRGLYLAKVTLSGKAVVVKIAK